MAGTTLTKIKRRSNLLYPWLKLIESTPTHTTEKVRPVRARLPHRSLQQHVRSQLIQCVLFLMAYHRLLARWHSLAQVLAKPEVVVGIGARRSVAFLSGLHIPRCE